MSKQQEVSASHKQNPVCVLNISFCCWCVAENAILAFGNGSDVKTGASQPGMSSPATDSNSPHLATTAPGVSMETEQNVLRAQIPTQVRRDGRLEMWCASFFLKKWRGAGFDLGQAAAI